MNISKDGTYQTSKNGLEVKIYSVDGNGNWPIHGAYSVENGYAVNIGKWSMVKWTTDGKTENPDFNLIEVKPRIKRKVWVNIYRHGKYSPTDVSVHQNKARAAENASTRTNRIACVEMVIDCEEGEGL